jgi:putative membrane protein
VGGGAGPGIHAVVAAAPIRARHRGPHPFGAPVGTAFEIAPIVTRAVGLPFGAAVWLGAQVVAVPALGLAEPPTRRAPRTEAEEFGMPLLYGLVTALVRRLLRG